MKQRQTLSWIGLACLLIAGCGQGPDTAADPVARPDREGIRAYHGAPPTIPHEVEAIGRENCLACHGPGLQNAGKIIAAVTPHPEWLECRQCHIEQTTETTFVANTLTPLGEPARVAMPSPFLPPYIPHRLDNERNTRCETCHIGPQAAPALRPGHGPRANCQQCHLPAYPADTGFGSAALPFP